MMVRVVLVSVLTFVLSVIVAWGLGGLLLWGFGSSPAEAFTREVASLLFVFMGIGFAAWALLLIVGAIRRRGLGWGTGGALLAALIAAAFNVVAVSAIAIARGGADIFAIAIAIEAALVFVVATAIAVPLARKLFPLPRPTP